MKRTAKEWSPDEYQMKKSLRKAPGAPKSYAEPEQEEVIVVEEGRQRERQGSRESIFDHKNWSLKEKIRLMVFLSFYEGLTDWLSERKSIYLYKNLSDFMKNKRTPEQCKNIHSLLKRKFTSIPGIVANMQPELEREENYPRLLLKYEREILAFEKKNCIKDGIYECEYMPISSRRNTEREEPERRAKERAEDRVQAKDKVKERVQAKEKAEMQVEVSLGRRAVIPGEFEARRERLVAECSYYFGEWLMCGQVLEKRRE